MIDTKKLSELEIKKGQDLLNQLSKIMSEATTRPRHEGHLLEDAWIMMDTEDKDLTCYLLQLEDDQRC